MDFDDNKWKVYKGQYIPGKKRYWMVYKQNDFGEPMWVCDSFEEAWDKLYLSMGWKR